MLIELAERIRDACVSALQLRGYAVPMAVVVIKGVPEKVFVPGFDSRMRKEVFFEYLQNIGMILEPQAIGFGAEAWVCDLRPERMRYLSEPEKQRILGRGASWLAEMGFADRYEAIQVTAQSAEQAYFLTCPFVRKPGDRGIHFEEERRRLVPQSEVGDDNMVKFYRQPAWKQKEPATKAGSS